MMRSATNRDAPGVVSVAVILIISLALGPGAEGSDPSMHSRFRDCPESPNCISSRATSASHYIAPIVYSGSLEDARQRLLEILANFVRARVRVKEERYLHVEITSLILRFVDDLEFEFDDAAKTIHMRSASRTGYFDFGVNRRRCEEIRELFNR